MRTRGLTHVPAATTAVSWLFRELASSAAPLRLLEHPALANVFGFDRSQPVEIQILIAGGEQAVRLAQSRAVERIADRAGVGEQRLSASQRNIIRKRPLAPPLSR